MSDPVSLAEAKAFLRVTQDAEDGVIAILLAAATERVEADAGAVLDADSPASLRVAVLRLLAEAFERREGGAGPWTRGSRGPRL